ncbi:MAG TPA: FAD-dependent oxidoreductase, partial [Sphingomicrobium sp.]|nr:FAD-dependent oxidoreductase [Sphingomicrobium sp.]
MSEFDVIIVGGGIAGASLGAEIAAKRKTLIVEAENQCGYHAT